MSIVMKGLEVATAMKEEMIKKVSELKAEGISPKLAILRVGSRADDLAYEKGAVKKMSLHRMCLRQTLKRSLIR